MSQVNYAQKGKYFLFLSDVESGDIYITPVEHVSLSNLEIIVLFNSQKHCTSLLYHVLNNLYYRNHYFQT